jgi:transcriptional regulator with XRE-family HTH domain
MYKEEAWIREGIRKALDIRELSGRQASMRAGVNARQVHRLLNTDHKPTFHMIIRLCEKGLEFSFDTILKLGKSEVEKP